MITRDKFSVWALILVLSAELLAILAMRFSIIGLWYVSLVLIIAIILLWKTGNERGYGFRAESIVASNLLANAIAPRAISAFYLLFFVIHVGWLTDSSYNLLLPHAYNNLTEIIVSLMGGVLGILFLIVFFPKSGGKSEEGVTDVFISGISNLFQPSEYKKLNLRPLVRMLQYTSDAEDTKCKLLILKTDQITDSISDKALSILRFIPKNESAEFPEGSNIDDKIKYLIQKVAQEEFPKKAWLRNLKDRIEFTDSCNYDDFNSCYKELNSRIAQYDKNTHTLHFNMTPGTSNIGGLMTLLAMDPQCNLYYYRQADNITDNKRMIQISKDYESLKRLFSETLERM